MVNLVSFHKAEATSLTVIPEQPLLIGQKISEKCQKSKWSKWSKLAKIDYFWHF